jgi:hypothetical protein
MLRKVLVLVLVLLAVTTLPASAGYSRPSPIFSIHLYQLGSDIWRYDDPSRGIYGEGVDVGPLAQAVMPGATIATLSFASHPIPSWQIVAWAQAPFNGGAFYRIPSFSLGAGYTFWLCPHLLDYFPTPPPDIWARLSAQEIEQAVQAEQVPAAP